MFIAADEAGGIWRSRNFTSASPVWQPLLDKWPILRTVRYVTVDPSNPRRILAATDAPLVLISEDSGDNWDTLGKFNGFGSYPIGKIIFDPTDNTNHTLYIHGGDAGIYKSTDMGNTWVPKTTGLPPGFRIRDLDYIISADNKITWFASNGYAALGTKILPNNLWKSINGGNTWTKESFQLFDVDSQKVVNENQTRNITFAFDHQPGAPKGVFAFVTNKNSGNILNVFRLINGTWKPIASNLKNAFNYNPKNGLAASSSFQASALSPGGVLYVATGNPSYNAIYQSNNSGGAWSSIEKSSNGIIPHPDLQCFAFFDNKVYIGNDGGIYRFTPLPSGLDGANVWESLNTNSLQTILIDGIGIHPTNPQIILSGTQDNGIILSQAGNSTYRDGGDNAKILFDPSPGGSKQYAYTTGGDPQYNETDKTIQVFYNSDDGGKTWKDKSPIDAFEQFAGSEKYAPFALHPANSSRIALALDRVYESFDKGETWGKQKSPIFNPVGIRDNGLNYGAQATAIAYGAGDVIWVAYGGRLLRTVNGGGNGEINNWAEMNQGVTFGGSIIQIAIDPARSWNTYLATDGGRIWQYSFLFGAPSMQWRDITSNLPNSVGVNSLCLVPGVGFVLPRLVVGTNAGVFISFDNGTSWARFNNNLPAGRVNDLQYHAPTKTLFAGIYGRGIFKTSMAAVLDPAGQPDVAIHIPESKNCDLGPVEGSSIQVSYFISHQLDNAGSTVTWKVDGSATPAAGETGTRSHFNIDLQAPAGSVTVSIEVQFNNGQKIFRSVQFTPHTQLQADVQAMACKLLSERLKPIPWWQWNPAMWTWDPKRNEIIRKKVSRDELKEMEKLMLKYLQEIRKEIERSK
jgi:photosystem II stability/assembly factor-like uncharacterized protein